MGLFDSFKDLHTGDVGGAAEGVLSSLGLVPDLSGAINNASFNPYNVSTSLGSSTYDKDKRLFSTSLDPRLTGEQGNIFEQLKGINPDQMLQLLRQKAQPFEKQQQLDLESRLFSQGRLGASSVDRPGGERRSLFDAIQQNDLNRQLTAEEFATNQRTQLLNQLFGIQGIEQGLFNPQATFGQIEQGAQTTQSNLMSSQAMAVPNLIGQLLSGAAEGYASK